MTEEQKFVKRARLALVNINNQPEWKLTDMALEATTILSCYDTCVASDWPSKINADEAEALKRFLRAACVQLGDLSYLYGG